MFKVDPFSLVFLFIFTLSSLSLPLLALVSVSQLIIFLLVLLLHYVLFPIPSIYRVKASLSSGPYPPLLLMFTIMWPICRHFSVPPMFLLYIFATYLGLPGILWIALQLSSVQLMANLASSLLSFPPLPILFWNKSQTSH